MKGFKKRIITAVLALTVVSTTACQQNNTKTSGDSTVNGSTELTIYSLYDNDYIRYAIDLYKADNSDININLEIGLTDDDAVTVNDALRSLNTSVLAGDGPDILILDGMPIDSYIEGGFLRDVSGVIQEVNQAEGLFESITSTYQEGNKIYAVPTRFKVPVIIGNEEILATIDGLDALANLLGSTEQEDTDTIYTMNLTNATLLLEKLYSSSSLTLLKKDGTIDKEKLNIFLEQSKNIYDVQCKAASSSPASVELTGARFTVEFLSDVGSMLKSGKDIGLLTITSIEEFSMVLFAIGIMDNGNYGFMQELSESVFISDTTVGISAKSENVDLAESFIKELLSLKDQKSTVKEGLPVNKLAFDEIYTDLSSNSESFGSISSGEKFLWPTEEEITEFKNRIESITKSSVSDIIIKETVLEEAKSCLEDGASVEDAADTIVSKLNLYLSE